MSTRPFPTPRLRISPPYGEEHEYIPEEDDENLNPEEWERHPLRFRCHQSNETLGDRLRQVEDDNRRLTRIVESSDLYSHSRQANHYSSRHARSTINREPRWTEPRDPSLDRPDHEQSRTRLKPEDIMLYDPKATGVALFIKRISQIVDLHGTSAVLKQLPLCMHGEAMEWYASLEEDTTEWMAYSLHIWASELRLRFQKDHLQCQKEADRLQFSFAREDTLSLRQYITRKRNLYDE